MKRRVNWDNYKDDYKQVRISKEEMEREFGLSKKQGFFTERAGELIITLVENICFSRRYKTSADSFVVREALIDHVLMYILENGLRLYKEERGAFSYFSLVAMSQAGEFFRTRFGRKKHSDVYGVRVKYKVNGEWVVFEEELYGDFEKIEEK